MEMFGTKIVYVKYMLLLILWVNRPGFVLSILSAFWLKSKGVHVCTNNQL